MKTAIATLAIVAVLLLCNTPVLADTGAGVSIELETTVTGGSSGGWIGGGGSWSWSVPEQSEDAASDSVIDETSLIDEPPPLLTDDSGSQPDAGDTEKPELPTGEIIPWYSYVNWSLLAFVCGGIVLLGFGIYIWKDERKRRRT